MKLKKKESVKNFKTLFVFIVAAILILTITILFLTAYIFSVTELITLHFDEKLGGFVVLILAASSIIIGLTLSFTFGQIIMKPIAQVIEGMTFLAEGKYDVRINLGEHNALKELGDCFNKLAIELENNEMFSAEFINNFSHELKTPLVSITGLISLMKKPNFPEAKRLEYLKIIEEEANRLSTITTNVLSLSKLEGQEIIKDKNKYNLSEQIRNCVLLLEKKWRKKKLSLSLDFDEYNIFANEDMLKQVWVNLLDNAIKFSYDKSNLIVDINRNDDCLVIRITNNGPTISDENKKLIFNKFYQVDKTHQVEGNGIGLSIVNKIVKLHNGKVEVESKEELTTFIVYIPKN